MQVFVTAHFQKMTAHIFQGLVDTLPKNNHVLYFYTDFFPASVELALKTVDYLTSANMHLQ